MRKDGRQLNQLRPSKITPGYLVTAEGSVLIEAGHTRVLCAATVEDSVPPFLRGTGKGWVTAEYSMLPRATATRTPREVNKGRPSGRTHEIQRLIGRSLRAVVDRPRWANAQSPSIATCCRPMAEPAPPPYRRIRSSGAGAADNASKFGDR